MAVVVVSLVGGTAVAFLAFLLRPGPFNNWREEGIVFENPFGIDAFAPIAGGVIAAGTIVALISAIVSIVAIVLRFRRSTGEARQQMRLLAFVGGTAGALIVTMFAGVGLLEAFGIYSEEEGPIFPIVFGLTAFTIVIGVPVSYLVAIFVTGCGTSTSSSRRRRSSPSSPRASLRSVCSWSSCPSASSGPAFPDGAGTPGVRSSAGCAHRTDPAASTETRRPHRVPEPGDAVRGPRGLLRARRRGVFDGGRPAADGPSPGERDRGNVARVLLRVGDVVRVVARWPEEGEESGEEHTVPVEHLGEELGVLAVTMPANDPMDPSKERLMRDLASQAGLVLRNVRLIEELRASRQRLVAAQDEERRRIERNLHDGAQQQLVALAVQLRLAEQMIGRDIEKERALIHRLENAANEALDELRDLARGIYPPLLADKGLEAALQAQARKSPVPVVVGPGALGRYARDVESAVYFCTLEALNNVSKYADASRAIVRFAQSNGQLTFSVTDDGRGFDPATAGRGTGLQGIADRLDAIGGASRS